METPFAGSLSTGVQDYIFHSTGIRRALDADEIEALLAHKKAHIRNGDAALSILIPLISPFMLTGKNVMFSVFDFRSREFQADADAAEQTGTAALASALEAVDADADASTIRRRYGVTPTMTSFSQPRGDGQATLGVFGLIYGDFALTEAHPTIGERIEALA